MNVARWCMRLGGLAFVAGITGCAAAYHAYPCGCVHHAYCPRPPLPWTEYAGCPAPRLSPSIPGGADDSLPESVSTVAE